MQSLKQILIYYEYAETVSYYSCISSSKRVLFKQERGTMLWNGNRKLPIYDKPKERISTEKAVEIMLNEELEETVLCQMPPTCVDKNCLFVIDLQKLSDPKDISCDDMGSWRANGTHPSYVAVDQMGTVTIVPRRKAEKGKFSGTQYKLIKRYYYHKTATDLQKTIFLMQGKNYDIVSIAWVIKSMTTTPFAFT